MIKSRLLDVAFDLGMDAIKEDRLVISRGLHRERPAEAAAERLR
jgi:hypothetical protein